MGQQRSARTIPAIVAVTIAVAVFMISEDADDLVNLIVAKELALTTRLTRIVAET